MKSISALTFFLMLVFSVLLSSTQAWAESISEHLHNQASDADLAIAPSADEIHSHSPRKIDELWVGIDQESYFNRAHPPVGITDYTFLSGRMRTRSEDHLINGAIDVGGSFATSIENYSFIELPEAYFNWVNEEKNVEFSVGRRRELWSALDEDWGFGLWQPVNRFDALHPTEQGLSGVFASWGNDVLTFTGFASLLFIPEQGSTFVVSNGNFVTHNPWFSKPPSSVDLFPGRPTSRLNFELQSPSTGSVINQPCLGLLMQVGSKRRDDLGAYLRAAFIRKPRNQLTTPFETTYILADNENYGDVVIYPRVEFQRLEALEFGYRTQTYATGFSALRDEPENQGVPRDSTGDSSRMSYQTLSSALYLSPYVEWRALSSESWGPRLRIMLLDTEGGTTQAQGLLSSSSSLFGYRVPYRRALSFQEDSMLWSRGSWRLDQRLRWIEETIEKGTVLMVDARLSYTDSWRFALAADILGSRQPDSDTSTFIARFRGNGNVSGHLTYIF